jgi:hypothetical protein
MSVPAAAAVAIVAVFTWPAVSVTTPAPAAIAPVASSSCWGPSSGQTSTGDPDRASCAATPVATVESAAA